MSRNNLQISQWGDGSIRLAFWDSRHGDDRIFRLNEDGTAEWITSEDDDSEAATTINLVDELRILCNQLSATAHHPDPKTP